MLIACFATHGKVYCAAFVHLGNYIVLFVVAGAIKTREHLFIRVAVLSVESMAGQNHWTEPAESGTVEPVNKAYTNLSEQFFSHHSQ